MNDQQSWTTTSASSLQRSGSAADQVFSEFFRDHYKEILTVCSHRLRDTRIAEEIAADALRITWVHLQDGESPCLPWVYQVVRNLIANEYRRERSASELTARLGQQIATLDFTEDVEAHDVLVGALRQLRQSDRELLYMTYWEQKTSQEIAVICKCSVSAVWVRVSRARTALAAQYRRDIACSRA